MAKHNEIGEIGEDISVKHLVKLKYKILERNYRKKWGEIDIIAEKEGILHFIEVKTVSCETNFDNYLPEENVHYFKKNRLKRIISTYLANVSHETKERELDFQINVIAIFFDPFTKKSRIRMLEDIIL
ncbi:MAG: YraN family protein [Patescibacteria group bacterium]